MRKLIPFLLFFFILILSINFVSATISGPYCSTFGCTFTGPVIFTNNVTLITANALFINNTLSLFDLAGNVKIVLNASGDSFFNSGNVGIGTTNPASPLETKRSGTGVHWTIDRGGTDVASISASSAGIEIDTIATGQIKFNNDQLDVDTQIFWDNGTAMWIDGGTGAVGIGTTAPGSLLSVRKDVSTAYSSSAGQGADTATIEIQNENGATNSFANIVFNLGSANIARIAVIDKGSGDTDMAFVVENAGAIAEAMRIDQTGAVGIGTTIPGEVLHIKKAGSTAIKTESTGNGNPSGLLISRERSTGENVNGGAIYIDSDTSDVHPQMVFQLESLVTFGDINTARMVIGDGKGNDGFVGIGTTAPNEKLVVVGNLNVTGDITYFGEMFNHTDDGNTIAIGDSTTYFNITSLRAGSANGFTVTNDALIPGVAGTYAFNWHIGFGNAGNNVEYQIALKIDEVIQNKCETHRKVGASGDVGSASGTCFLSLNINDEVRLGIKNIDGTQDAIMFNVNVNAIRIGD